MSDVNNSEQQNTDLNGLIDLSLLALFGETCISPLVGSVLSLANSLSALNNSKANGEGITLSITQSGGLRITYTYDDGEDEDENSGE